MSTIHQADMNGENDMVLVDTDIRAVGETLRPHILLVVLNNNALCVRFR